jgi:hypothetical protein
MPVKDYTFTADLTLTPRVRERIKQVHDHIAAMRAERLGWGDTAAREALDTAMSFLDALDILTEATEVWCDGGAGMSFGGVLPGGIVFGCIAREVPRRTIHEFDHAPMDWTFHS